LAIVSLFCERLFQNHEGFHLACTELLESKPAEALAYEILLHQRFAFRCDEGFWTASENRRLAYPDRPRRVFGKSEPPAAAANLQAGCPAYVALPTGLVGELELEGD
jgi:hypothetical protein